MKPRTLIIGFTFLLTLTACGLMPEYRVFQKKVNPAMAEKPPGQIEGERQAAAFLAARSVTADANSAAQLQEMHAVAEFLSVSLGVPKKPVTAQDYQKVIDGLQAGLRAEQKKTDAWKAFAKKYANTPLENTGIDLVGPAGVLGLVGVVAACIACPAFGWVLLRLVPLLWGTLKRMTSGIETFAAEMPAEAAKLKKDYLGRKMDSPDKLLIERIKNGLDPENHTTDPTPAQL